MIESKVMSMGKGYIYKCPKCKKETTLRMGVGFVCPNPPEIEADIKVGLYGKKAQDFLIEHPDYIMDASLEVYQCKCGNIQNEYHVVLKAEGVKSFANRQHCKKCGSVMKKLSDPLEIIDCPECGSAIDLTLIEMLYWD